MFLVAIFFNSCVSCSASFARVVNAVWRQWPIIIIIVIIAGYDKGSFRTVVSSFIDSISCDNACPSSLLHLTGGLLSPNWTVRPLLELLWYRATLGGSVVCLGCLIICWDCSGTRCRWPADSMKRNVDAYEFTVVMMQLEIFLWVFNWPWWIAVFCVFSNGLRRAVFCSIFFSRWSFNSIVAVLRWSW